MGNKQVFKKYYSRLAWEGILKALICGFILGFAMSAVLAFIAIMVNNFNLSSMAGLWISLGIGIASAIVSIPFFYFAIFRPKTKQIARRVDRLGLDERVITMIELEKDESYVAMRQREDAKEKLLANRKPLKLSVFVAPIVVVAVLFFCSGTMMVVSATTFEDPIEWTHPGDWQPQKNSYISISYVVSDMVYHSGGSTEEGERTLVEGYWESNGIDGGGGYIEGEADQFVIRGHNATTITAVADFGYEFVAWSDGVLTAERTDRYIGTDTSKIQEDTVLSAVFQKVNFGLPSSKLGKSQSSHSDEGDPDALIDPDKIKEIDEDYKYESENQFYDGKQFYGDQYQDLYDAAMKLLSEKGDSLTAEERAFIEKYTGML